MRQSERLWRGLACASVLTACSGFDPASLVPPKADPDESGAAGYSYDPGPSGGRTNTVMRANGADGSGAVSSFGAGGTGTGASASEGAPGAAGGMAGRGSAASSGRGGSSSGAVANGSAGGRTTASGAGRGGTSVELAGAEDGGGVGGRSVALPRELFFSEYVEAGADKALEIIALATTDLEGCVVETYTNGASMRSRTLELAGPLEAGSVYTVCSSKLAAKIHCDLSTSSLNFNGNDALALVCDGATLDVIGEIGFDPGGAWSSTGDGDGGMSGAGAGGAGASEAGAQGAAPSSSPASTADQTLRRRCGITSGDADGTDVFEPSVQWIALPADTLDGLGDPACG